MANQSNAVCAGTSRFHVHALCICIVSLPTHWASGRHSRQQLAGSLPKLLLLAVQMVQGLPLPLLKICDFGYSKAHFMSAPKSKVGL